jgi:hypothetical protein
MPVVTPLITYCLPGSCAQHTGWHPAMVLGTAGGMQPFLLSDKVHFLSGPVQVVRKLLQLYASRVSPPNDRSLYVSPGASSGESTPYWLAKTAACEYQGPVGQGVGLHASLHIISQDCPPGSRHWSLLRAVAPCCKLANVCCALGLMMQVCHICHNRGLHTNC